MASTKKSTNPRQNSRVLPLHHYAYKNDIEAIRKALANSSTDICAKDMSGRTALFVATCFSRVEIARMLLALGCDPNIANNDGDTPLHEATEKSSLPMVQLLLKSGAGSFNIHLQQKLWVFLFIKRSFPHFLSSVSHFLTVCLNMYSDSVTLFVTYMHVIQSCVLVTSSCISSKW